MSRIAEQHPTEYPLILFFHYIRGKMPTFSLAKSIQIAQQTNQEATTEPVNILTLTSEWGYKETHHFLKKFGKEWICKTGTVYYKEKRE